MVPAPVLVEVDHLLDSYTRTGSFGAVLDQIQSGALVVEDLIARDYERVDELLRTYDDLKVGCYLPEPADSQRLRGSPERDSNS